jgi:hypothetical protein
MGLLGLTHEETQMLKDTIFVHSLILAGPMLDFMKTL